MDRALRVNDKCKFGTTVFLGTNLDTFDLYASEPPIIHKPDNEIWLAYCSTLGSSYDLICVFDALELLSEKDIKLKFIIMGDGPRRNEFEQYVVGKDVDVIFKGSLPYNQMCSLLCECDITVNPIEDYYMGFNCRNGDAIDLSERLGKLILDEGLRKQMGANARCCAEERFDRKNSYTALLKEIVWGRDYAFE